MHEMKEFEEEGFQSRVQIFIQLAARMSCGFRSGIVPRRVPIHLRIPSLSDSGQLGGPSRSQVFTLELFPDCCYS